MICNGRKLVSEPEWTRVRPSLKQKSLIEYITTCIAAQLLEVSGNMHVDGTDIGSSDHFLVWMELSRATKSPKRKCVIRRWCLDRFGDDEKVVNSTVERICVISMVDFVKRYNYIYIYIYIYIYSKNNWLSKRSLIFGMSLLRK